MKGILFIIDSRLLYINGMKDKLIYLDYAASTPVDPAVKKAMEPYFSEVFANAGALHWQGQKASAAIFQARGTIAKAIGAKYNEVIFTGSATEANNLVLRGVVKAYRSNWSNRTNKSDKIDRPRIIISAIEHESVLVTCKDLESEGVEVIYIPVNRDGIIDLKKLKVALNERTILVSIIYVNNEVGTIQPISKISEIIRNFREIKSQKSKVKSSEAAYPFFHTDAVQAIQYLNCDVNNLGVDFMTLSAHKIYGPKGIGALYVRNSKYQILNSKQIPNFKFKTQNFSDLGFRVSNLSQLVSPIVTGGGQEYGLRSGTENTPSIVGFAKAVERNEKLRNSEIKRILNLRNYFLRGIKKINSKILVNGSMKERIPNNLNIYFPGHLAADLLIKLDLGGVAVSPGAACSARAMRPSYVLEAMGLPHQRCVGSLRMTLGRQTKKGDLDRFLKILKRVIALVRHSFSEGGNNANDST